MVRLLFLLAIGLAACGGGNGMGGDDDDDDQPPARCGDGHVDSNEQCDDGNSIAGDGCTLCMIDTARTAKIDATWQLATVAGGMADCPAGYDTAALSSQQVDMTGAPTGAPTVDLFACGDGMGASTALKPGLYTTTLAITDHAQAMTFATSLPQQVDLSDATDKPVAVKFLTDGGRFHLAWQLVKMSDSTPVTCDAVDTMARVRVSIQVGTAAAVNTSFPCAAGMAVTDPYVAGSYTVGVAVVNNSFSNKGQITPLANQMLTAPDGLTDLGTIQIPVTGL